METTGVPTDLIATVSDCRRAGDLYISVIRLIKDVEERGKVLPDGSRGTAFLNWLHRIEPQYGDEFVIRREKGEIIVRRYIAQRLEMSEDDVDLDLARATLLQMCASGVIPGDDDSEI